MRMNSLNDSNIVSSVLFTTANLGHGISELLQLIDHLLDSLGLGLLLLGANLGNLASTALPLGNADTLAGIRASAPLKADGIELLDAFLRQSLLLGTVAV